MSIRNKLLKSFFSFFTCCGLGTSIATMTCCNIFNKRDYIHVQNISFRDETILIEMNDDAIKPELYIYPNNATDQRIIWETNNDNISVSSFGYITPKSIGKTILTARSIDGDLTAQCTINVIGNHIPVTLIQFDDPSQLDVTLILNKKDSMTLTPTIYPLDASDKRINWSSSDSKVVDVDDNGNITACSVGQAKIIATTVDGNHQCESRITVTDKISVEAVELNIHDLVISNFDDKYQLVPKIIPEDATNKKVIWKSTNKNVVDIDDDGNIIPKEWGNAIIKVITDDGNFEDECKISITAVNIHIQRFEISTNDFTFKLGDPDAEKLINISSTIFPINATDKTIFWTSSDEHVISLNSSIGSNVIVRPVQNGDANIIAKTKDRGFEQICHIHVNVGYNVILNVVESSAAEIYGSNIAKYGEDYKCEFNLVNYTYDLNPESLSIKIGDNELTVDDFKLWLTCNELIIPSEYVTGDIVINWTPAFWKEAKKVHNVWLGGGNICVNLKLSCGHQCTFLSEDVDDECGYVDYRSEQGSRGDEYDNVLIIPDYYEDNDTHEKYYFTYIPSNWSDGQNYIDGVIFNTKHLLIIEKEAFCYTDVLNFYEDTYTTFSIPEGVEIIGDDAFYGTDYGVNYIPAFSFPSTLKQIGTNAFRKSAELDDDDPLSAMFFRSFPELGEKVFDSFSYNIIIIPIHDNNDSAYEKFWNALSSNIECLDEEPTLLPYKLPSSSSFKTYQSFGEIPLEIWIGVTPVLKCWTSSNPKLFILLPTSEEESKKIPDNAEIRIIKTETYGDQTFCLQWKNFYSFETYNFNLYNFNDSHLVGNISFKIDRWSW